MSEQNPTAPEPKEPAPGYQPPATPESAEATPAEPGPEASGGYQPPSYLPPPPASGGYQPPDFITPASAVPPAGGYQPPGSFEPPASGGYEPPAQGGYQPPITPQGQPTPGSYGQPPSSGYPEPTGFPPASGYQQPGGAYPPASLTTVGGATLVDWPKRALGGLVDYVAASIVIGVLVGILGNISSGLSNVVNTLLGIGWYIVYLGYKTGTTGVTFGRSLAKTKLVSEQTGQPIGVGNGILRQLAHIVDSVICYIGWLFPLWDSKRQTLADKIMKTVVIDNSADPDAGNYNWNP